MGQVPIGIALQFTSFSPVVSQFMPPVNISRSCTPTDEGINAVIEIITGVNAANHRIIDLLTRRNCERNLNSCSLIRSQVTQQCADLQ